MADMVDTVAKAIYEARNGRGALPWAHQVKSHKAPYMADARAAIEAMRDPTDEMVRDGEATAAVASGHVAAKVYGRMLVTALSPSLKEQERT